MRTRDQWTALSPTQRVGLAILLIGVLSTLALWLFLSSQVPYDVAFRDLKPDEAAAVTDKLKELQIPYQMDGDTTVRVPSAMVAEARVRVAGAGVLKGGSVGYEIFNQPSFGLSDFIQHVDYQRALEGELARSISQLDGIQSARVHLAIPRPSVFVSQQRDPSAAVVIGLNPGYHVDRTEARAIVDLVVGAVEGMKPAQVVLLDTQGQLLHQGDEWSGADPAGVGDQYATQRAMESDVESRLQQMLDRVLGTGHSTTQVSLLLDWSHSDTTSETYNPNGQQSQIKTDQEVHEVQTPGSPVGGVPGVTSNVPTYQQNTPVVGQGTGNERTESSKTFEVSKVVQKTQNAPGTVKRLSVSIAVDSGAVDATMVDTLTQMAKGAVGFDASRGDTVTVVPVPLKQLQGIAKDSSIATSSQQERTWEIARLAALVAGPVLAIIILALLLLGRRAPRKAKSIRVTAVPEVAAPAPASTPLPIDTGARVPTPQHVLVREQIQAMAERDPALVASILKEWVREDRRKRQ